MTLIVSYSVSFDRNRNNFILLSYVGVWVMHCQSFINFRKRAEKDKTEVESRLREVQSSREEEKKSSDDTVKNLELKVVQFSRDVSSAQESLKKETEEKEK